MSSSSPKSRSNAEHEAFIKRVLQFIDGSATPGDVATLNEELDADEIKRKLFVQLSVQSRAVHEILAPADMPTDLLDSSESFDALLQSVDEEKCCDSHFGDMLAALDDMKGEAAQPVDISDVIRERQRKARQTSRSVEESLQRLAGVSGPDTENLQTRHYVIPKPLFYGSIAAVVAVAALIIWPMVAPSDPSGAEATAPVTVQGKALNATLASAADAQWVGRDSIAIGASLEAGEFELTQGVARILFANKAQIIVEAPAHFHLEHDKLIQLESGKVVGLCPTPESHGFTVATKSGRVVDRGTEFGVQAEDETFVAVFDGEVDLFGSPDNRGVSQTIALATGQGGRTDRRGVLEPKAVPLTESDIAFQRNVPTAYELTVKKLKPIGYWRFDFDRDGLADNSFGLHSYRGKWPDSGVSHTPGAPLGGDTPNHGVELDGSDGFIHIPDDANGRANGSAYTIALWVKLDEVSKRNIIVRTSKDRPDFHFSHQIRTTENGRFEHYAFFDGPFTSIIGSTRIEPDTWYHVAISASNNGFVDLYVNGVRDAASVAVDNRVIWQGSDHYRIGAATARDQLEIDPDRYRKPLDGCVDEVAIFDRALKPTEIRSLYRASMVRPSE